MRERRLNLGSTHCRNSHPWLLERTHRDFQGSLPMSFEPRRGTWSYRCPSPPGHRQCRAYQNIRRMIGRCLSLVPLLHTEPRVAVGRFGLLPWTYGGARGCRYVAKYEAKEGSSLLRRNPPKNRLWVLPGVACDSRGEIDPTLDRSNRFVPIHLQSQVEGIAVFQVRDGQPQSGPDRTDVSVRSRSHLNDWSLGPVLDFSRAIGSVSVPVQTFLDRSVGPDRTDGL